MNRLTIITGYKRRHFNRQMEDAPLCKHYPLIKNKNYIRNLFSCQYSCLDGENEQPFKDNIYNNLEKIEHCIAKNKNVIIDIFVEMDNFTAYDLAKILLNELVISKNKHFIIISENAIFLSAIRYLNYKSLLTQDINMECIHYSGENKWEKVFIKKGFFYNINKKRCQYPSGFFDFLLEELLEIR